MQKTYLILDTGSNLLKIGKSCNVTDRLKALQSCCGSKLEIKHIFNVDIENILHIKLKDKRIHGEWFDISFLDVIALVNSDDNLRMATSTLDNTIDSKTNHILGKHNWIHAMRIGSQKNISFSDLNSSLFKTINSYEKVTGRKFKLIKGKITRTM